MKWARNAVKGAPMYTICTVTCMEVRVRIAHAYAHSHRMKTHSHGHALP